MAIDFNRPYTFSQLFEMQITADELVADFGYKYEKASLKLPDLLDQDAIGGLDVDRLVAVLKRTRSVNEQTKREVIVTQVVQELVLSTDALLRIEFSINVTPQLQGILDYLVSKDQFQELLVIEAKRNDLDYGFTQLAAQLICLDQWERSPKLEQQPVLLGAVTTGEVWRFGRLDRHTKQITENVSVYTVPDDLATIMKLLKQAMLSGNNQLH